MVYLLLNYSQPNLGKNYVLAIIVSIKVNPVLLFYPDRQVGTLLTR